MKNLFTSFSAERDPAGTLIVDFHSAIGYELIKFALGLVVATVALVLPGLLSWPLPGVLSWAWSIVAAIVMFILIALGIKLMFWQRSKSQVRVSVDRAKSRVFIDSHNGRAELSIRDIEKAVFGSTPARAATTIYRLEFLMRNQEHVPSTSAYCIASQRDRDSVLAALNNELIGRSAMLS